MDLFLNEVGSNVWEPQSNSGQEPMAHKYPESLSSLYSRKQPVSRIQVNADGEPVEQTNFEDRPDANLSSHSRFRSDLVQNPTDYRVGTDCVAERAVEPMTNSCPSMAPPSLPITPGRFAPSFNIPAAVGHDMTRSLLNASTSTPSAAARTDTVSDPWGQPHDGFGWRSSGHTTVTEAPQSAPESSSLVKQLTTKGPDSISLVASPSSRGLFGFFCCSDVDQRKQKDIIRLVMDHCTPANTAFDLTDANAIFSTEYLKRCADRTLDAIREVAGRDNKSISVTLVAESDFEQLRQDLHIATWFHKDATSEEDRDDIPLASLTTFWSPEAGTGPEAFGIREVSTADGTRKAFYAPFSVAGPRPELIKVDESEPQAWT